MDKVILGKNCFLEDKIGMFRPNNNQIIVGGSGSGKSMSVFLPTILNTQEASMIVTYSKAGEARKMARYLRKKGYETKICDLTNPEKSNVSFDPLYYVNSYLDVEDLSTGVILANPDSKNPKDTYWNDGAANLLTALTLGTIMTKNNATMSDVLDLLDEFTIEEYGKGIRTSLDSFFLHLNTQNKNCQAATCFRDFCQLPFSTAGCIRDTLAKAIRRLFPEPIRQLMRKENLIDFEELAKKKTALIIITSPVNTSLYFFANLLFGTAIKQLLEFAEKCKNQRLPREVRLMFDDFACAAKINDYCRHISIFRAAGLSAMMLVQSESQLRSLYTDAEAETLLNNCSCYVYFPGGMDLTTCKNISQRLDIPMTEIMYAPTGNVFIMRSGQKPVIVPRYDTPNSREYQEFLRLTNHVGKER